MTQLWCSLDSPVMHVQGDNRTPAPLLTKEGSVGVVASTAAAAAHAVTDAANTAVDTVRLAAVDAAATIKTTMVSL